ncbi:MAG TPA: Rieske 2Fe-2S domain-containing protein [Ramlibacter sp.]|nr:Rieske 2Fe-2S domain-containing protein [Ramlibacter sp.]
MLSRQDNETICRVGPGTPMGQALRRYWVPILSAHQLPSPGCDPVKVELFGERYVAFRDGSGKVGLLDENCPHRSASLALGRVEADGIRCLFHGWKFSVSGAVLETPTVSDPRFRERFRARAFPVREAGGMIWAYVGPAELEPEFPHWHYFDQPAERLLSVTFVVPCNYVQVQEALLDSAHLTVLHQDAFKRTSDIDFATTVSTVTAAADPKIEVEDTTFGFHYVAMRPAPGGPDAGTVARVTSYVAPFHVLNANGDFVGMIVPIDDHRTLHHFVWWSDSKDIAHEPHRSEQLRFVGLDEETQHKAGLHYDTWHLPGKPSRINNFLQDREAMRNGAYSGLPIFFPEDSAMLVSSGEIRDRSKEMLSPGDVAIVRLYKTLLGVARQVQEGREPVGLRIDSLRIHGRNGVIREGQPWQALVPEHQRVCAAQPAAVA